MSAAAPKVRTGLATCIHCGTGFHPTAQLADFCCRGCQFVHALIAQNGLCQFYDLQEGGVQPVKSLVFQKRDYLWLDELARLAEADATDTPTLVLDLQGVSCIGCVWLIEKLFTRRPGALAITLDPSLGRLELRWRRGAFDVPAFARELQSFGYLVGPPGPEPRAASRGLIVRLGICAALAMNAMLFTLPGYLGMERTFQFTQLFERITLAVGTLSLLIGGSYFFTRTWHSLRNRVLHIDLPISLGLLAAYSASVFAWVRGAHGFVYFDFVSIFVFLMLVGRWLQQKAVERNRGQRLGFAPERAQAGDEIEQHPRLHVGPLRPVGQPRGGGAGLASNQRRGCGFFGASAFCAARKRPGKSISKAAASLSSVMSVGVERWLSRCRMQELLTSASTARRSKDQPTRLRSAASASTTISAVRACNSGTPKELCACRSRRQSHSSEPLNPKHSHENTLPKNYVAAGHYGGNPTQTGRLG